MEEAIKRPLIYYEKRDYIMDDVFFEEYKNEIDWSWENGRNQYNKSVKY